jgi:hypothetical protein
MSQMATQSSANQWGQPVHRRSLSERNEPASSCTVEWACSTASRRAAARIEV